MYQTPRHSITSNAPQKGTGELGGIRQFAIHFPILLIPDTITPQQNARPYLTNNYRQRFQINHSKRPAPKKLATTTAARLPASPLMEGASPGAILFELEELEEPEEVEVPLVVLWSDWTRADRLASVEKAAVTALPLLQSDVRVPDPDTKLTVAHYRGVLSAGVSPYQGEYNSLTALFTYLVKQPVWRIGNNSQNSLLTDPALGCCDRWLTVVTQACLREDGVQLGPVGGCGLIEGAANQPAGCGMAKE